MANNATKTWTCDVKGCLTSPVTINGAYDERPRGWGFGYVDRSFDVCNTHAKAIGRILRGE